MSDLSAHCPQCGSKTTDIGQAFRDGEPCPYCGYTHEPQPLYVPVCETCGRDIHLNDDEKWVHR